MIRRLDVTRVVDDLGECYNKDGHERTSFIISVGPGGESPRVMLSSAGAFSGSTGSSHISDSIGSSSALERLLPESWQFVLVLLGYGGLGGSEFELI